MGKKSNSIKAQSAGKQRGQASTKPQATKPGSGLAIRRLPPKLAGEIAGLLWRLGTPRDRELRIPPRFHAELSAGRGKPARVIHIFQKICAECLVRIVKDVADPHTHVGHPLVRAAKLE